MNDQSAENRPHNNILRLMRDDDYDLLSPHLEHAPELATKICIIPAIT